MFKLSLGGTYSGYFQFGSAVLYIRAIHRDKRGMHRAGQGEGFRRAGILLGVTR